MGRKRKKRIEPICRNCRLFDGENEMCRVTILLGDRKYNMPVFPNDRCHMEELGIEVKQIRWWTEDPKTGEKTEGEGVVKMEYPVDLNLWHGFLDQ
jgi:hypothetical protein